MTKPAIGFERSFLYQNRYQVTIDQRALGSPVPEGVARATAEWLSANWGDLQDRMVAVHLVGEGGEAGEETRGAA